MLIQDPHPMSLSQSRRSTRRTIGVRPRFRRDGDRGRRRSRRVLDLLPAVRLVVKHDIAAAAPEMRADRR